MFFLKKFVLIIEKYIIHKNYIYLLFEKINCPFSLLFHLNFSVLIEFRIDARMHLTNTGWNEKKVFDPSISISKVFAALEINENYVKFLNSIKHEVVYF